MRELQDGTVIQDGLEWRARKNSGKEVREIFYPVEGQVVAVYPLDDDANMDQESVLVDVHVTELGIDIFKARWTSGRASADNYVHHAPQAATANVDGTPFVSKVLNPKVSNGDTVVVVFPFGDVQRGRVICVVPSSQSGPEGASPDPRPLAADGDVYKVRHQGTTLTIDNDGHVTLTATETLDETIPKLKTVTVALPDENGDMSTVVLDGQTGNLHYLGSKGTEVTYDNENDAIDLKCDNGDELSVSKANGIQGTTPSSGGTTLSMKSGHYDIAGAQGASIKSSGGPVVVQSDGGDVSVKATAGKVTVDATGDIEATSSAGAVKLTGAGGAELKLATAKVALGSSAAELLDLFSQTLDILSSTATDLSTTTAPGFGAPISSVAAFAALIPQVAAIKTLLTSIKGTL